MLQSEIASPSPLPVRRAKPSASASAVSWECSLCSSSRTMTTRRKGRRRRRRRNSLLPLPQRAAKTETKAGVGTLYTGTDGSWPERVGGACVCVRVHRNMIQAQDVSSWKELLHFKDGEDLKWDFYTLSWSARMWGRGPTHPTAATPPATPESHPNQTHTRPEDSRCFLVILNRCKTKISLPCWAAFWHLII